MTRIGEYQLALDEASSVALWAYLEKERTSAVVWRWPRRRFLDRVFKAKCEEVDRLKKAIAGLEAEAERKRADIREAADAHLPGAGDLLP